MFLNIKKVGAKLVNKKGFTLIELVCTVIILGMIFVIVVPRVSDILRDSRKEAHNDSIEAIDKAVSLYISASDLDAMQNLPLQVTIKDDKYFYKIGNGDEVEGNILEIKGKVPDSGSITINYDKSYKYQIYDKSLNICTTNDDTNYLNAEASTFEVSDFNGESKVLDVGDLDLSSFEVGDILLLDYDAIYTDAIYKISNPNAGIYLVDGNNNNFFEPIKLSGSGIYHVSSTYKIKDNKSLNLSFKFDDYTEGNIKISNVKITKKGAKKETLGECVY